ncbi:FliA/WhiG family RNA polymerase sigma factor [uncultured Nocardioides sp.]|uniref:FliA/WhiG family RNA polymerase sigma factor n=1 Tax=uncultured Nocardioides sp. TaxID=198441 RepID=UPI00260EAD87|nr:FliA/WhiG family RNA polymerase sigma factor [uncultured Nocardioides sp.]
MTTGERLEASEDLWAAYRAEPTEALRHQLVLQYSPLVKYVAGRVRVHLPATVESADLVSEGVIGLMDAIDRFEPERGWEFPTYAVPRIRGAILDSIRAADWVPRSVRSRLRAVDEARTTLQHRLGRSPEPEELAEETGLTLAELRGLLERPTHVAAAGDDELAEVDDAGPALDEAFEDEATRETLKSAVKRLPERDQVIVALYFFEGFTLSEIGQVLDVTESRVSQLRTRALKALREELASALAE